MKIYKLIFSMLLLSMFTFTSCVWKQAATHVAIKKKAFTAQITSVSTANNQFILTGTNLDQVTTVKLKDGSAETLFEIASQNGSQIVVNSLTNISVAAGKMLDFIIADAYSAATFSVNFSLCDSTLNGKAFNCAAQLNDRDVLSYDSVSQTWKPRNINGLNFVGVYSVNGLVLEATLPVAANGDYYIVSGVGGNLRPTSGDPDVPVSSGDWLSYSDNNTWQVVKNGKNGVASFNGRVGAVVPKNADYKLSQMGDVTIAVAPSDKSVLTYNQASAKWIPAATLPASTVNATSIVAGSITGGVGGNLAATTVSGGGVTGNIVQGTITNTEISAGALIDLSKLANITVGATALPLGATALPAVLANTDNLNAAFVKLKDIPQDYVSRTYTGGTQTLAGTYNFTPGFVTVATPVTAVGPEVTNITYVTSYVATQLGLNGIWNKGAASSINYMAGKVGIGTVTPSGNLDVLSTTGDQAVNFISPVISKINIGNAVAGATATRAELGFDNTAVPYAFWQGVASAPLALQPIGGSVGIGKTAPAYMLDVNGEINATGVRVNGTAIGSSQWITSGIDISYSTANGKVGVGTALPNSTLHVNGPIATAVTTTALNAYAVLASDSVILATPTAAASYTLPTPIGITGRQYTIKNLSGFTITVTPAAGVIWNTTASAGTYALTTGKTMTVVSNGTDWYIISLF